MRSFFRLLPVLALPALAACTVGPEYEGPSSAGALPTPPQFVRAGPDMAATAPAIAPWWTALGDPVLDELEQRALAGNPGIAVAQARLKQARSALRLDRTNGLPTVNAQAMAAHAQLPGIDLGSSGNDGGGGSGGQNGGDDSEALNFYNLGFDASWEIDLFGGHRRSVEASRASLAAAEANVTDAQVSLAAEIAQAYVNLRDRQHRLALARQAADSQRDIVKLTEQRHARGTTSALDVEHQRSLLEQSERALLPLQTEESACLNALATLTGEAPGALDSLLAAPGAVPLPPASVTIGDPATLLQRRPDIRAAERRLAAATAKIGVAEAARFPRLSFMGLIGIGGTQPEDVVDLDKLSAIAMPRLSWNILDFGRNAARVGQAEGAREEAAAAYRQTVLSALRDAEDALSRYGASRQSVASVARTRTSAQRAFALTQQRFTAGTASRIDLLDAQRQSLDAEQALSQAMAAMTADYAALQKALGLGWH
ncbi:MAG: RND transporter [Sphingobium sp. 32-64-5]|nr:MAG: RND transporter [Sphingobium sp. 32-64-5]